MDKIVCYCIFSSPLLVDSVETTCTQHLVRYIQIEKQCRHIASRSLFPLALHRQNDDGISIIKQTIKIYRHEHFRTFQS